MHVFYYFETSSLAQLVHITIWYTFFLVAYFLLNKMKTYFVVSRVLILDQLLSNTLAFYNQSVSTDVNLYGA
jgi:hypothetical protein